MGNGPEVGGSDFEMDAGNVWDSRYQCSEFLDRSEITSGISNLILNIKARRRTWTGHDEEMTTGGRENGDINASSLPIDQQTKSAVLCPSVPLSLVWIE